MSTPYRRNESHQPDLSLELRLSDLKRFRLLTLLVLGCSVLALLGFQITGGVLLPLLFAGVSGRLLATQHAQVVELEERLQLAHA